MGGTIDLKSRKPFGTEFFFEIAPPATEPVAEASVPRAEPEAGESTAILLLSPSGSEIRSLQARLSRWGWSPLAFHRTVGLLAHLESLGHREAVPPLVCDDTIVQSCDSADWHKLRSTCGKFVSCRRKTESETKTSDGETIALGRILPKPLVSADLASIIDGFRSEVEEVVPSPSSDPGPSESSASAD